MAAKLSPTMANALTHAAQHGFQGTVSANARTESALITRGLVTVDHSVKRMEGSSWLYPVLTAAGWAYVWETYSLQRPADEGRLTEDEALREAYTNLGVVRAPRAPVVDQATTNRSVDAYLSREYPALFPGTDEQAPMRCSIVGSGTLPARLLKDSDYAVTSAHAYHARTGRPYPNTPPADGMATVTAWAHRQQSGMWTVDGTTVAVRTDDRGHIRGSVIVLETIGSKFPGS